MPPERRSNLPASRTRLVGREADLLGLRELVSKVDGRLVTCTGAGGSGKTSLALEVARQLTSDIPDGVWLVELARLTEPGLVPSAVATVFGVKEGRGRSLPDSLVGYLESRRLLLLLDNCEHVIEACAALTERLLSQCPDVRILATSREPLRIAGEQTWRVPLLVTPDADCLPPLAKLAATPAVQMFVERAREGQPHFELTAQNATAVARICTRVDGLPLALELAAARLRGLTVEQLAARLHDTFAITAGGSRTAPTRQQTLRATLDWSYELLTEPEAALFRQLAVFAGTWTLEAAEAVCAADQRAPLPILDLLLLLVDKSLVVFEERNAEAVYSYLQPIRQYALERLQTKETSGELEKVRRQHTTYYLALAESVAEGWRERTLPPASLARLEREHDNLRTALAWSAEKGEVEIGLRLAGALWYLWRIHGHLTEGVRWLEMLLPVGRAVPRDVRARALLAAGNLAWARGDVGRAELWLDEALALYRTLVDGDGIALSLLILGDVAAAREAHATARVQLDEALVLARSSGNAFLAAAILHDLGEVNLYERAYAVARECFEESVVLARQAGDDWWAARAITSLGRIAGLRGDLKHAAALAAEALGTLRERVSPREIAECLDLLARAASLRGQPDRAARIFGAAEVLREAVGAPRLAPDRAAQERATAAVRIALGETVFDALRVEGRALGAERAIDYAVAGQQTASSSASQPETATERPLTAREREVAIFVARGLTNRQIAEALVIAEGTADRHVSNVLGKLGLASRAALAAWTVEHGLLAGRPI